MFRDNGFSIVRNLKTMLSPTVIAIPIFALLIAVEAFLAIRESSEYDRKDAWNNILIGFVSVVFGFFFTFIQVFFYELLAGYAPYQMPMNTVWAWVLLIIIDDLMLIIGFIALATKFVFSGIFTSFIIRQINIMFKSVAVRQSWFGGIAHWIFYVPVALVGFPFWALVLVHGSNLIYQFWIHTKVIKKMGWLEHIRLTRRRTIAFITASNDQYLDMNYAGIFIIWDKLFGTFVEEKEDVKYGITTPLNSYNPIWINTHAWVETYAAMREKKTLRGKFRCFFGSPNMDFDEFDSVKPNFEFRKE